MTLHITDCPDMHCGKCGKECISYKKDFTCPWCRKPADTFYDLIPAIVGSLMIHKRNYGRFTPQAWYTGSMAEHIQSITFGILDALEEDIQKNPKLNPESHLKEILDKALNDWTDKIFEQYIKDVVFESYHLYKKRTKDIGDDGDMETPSFIKNKIKK